VHQKRDAMRERYDYWLWPHERAATYTLFLGGNFDEGTCKV